MLGDWLEENNFFLRNEIVSLIEAKLCSKRKNFLLLGPPGVGKTQLAHLVAKYLDAKMYFYQCTRGTSEDDLLYKYIPSEETRSGIKITYGPLPLALLSSQKQKTVLIIDEIDKSRPSVDAFLLDYLQNYRCSLYINDKNQIIRGNPDNLVIFLTSNEERELSEPLIRRLTVIRLSYLSPSFVFNFLKEKFGDAVAKILTQIYVDTINAGLRKPATLQELIEAGEIMQSSPNLPLDFIIRSIIIKYDDDLKKFNSYKRNGESQTNENEYDDDDLGEYYENPKPAFQEYSPSLTKKTVQEILSSYVKKQNVVDTNPPQTDQEAEVTFITPFKNSQNYDQIIKAFDYPEPPNDPNRIAKFSVIKDESGKYIVSEKPLTIDDIKRLKGRITEYEAYVEDFIIFPKKKNIYKEIGSKGTITYYSKNLMQVRYDKYHVNYYINEEDYLYYVKIVGNIVKDNAHFLDLNKRNFDYLYDDVEEFIGFLKNAKKYYKVQTKIKFDYSRKIRAVLKVKMDDAEKVVYATIELPHTNYDTDEKIRAKYSDVIAQDFDKITDLVKEAIDLANKTKKN